MLRLKLWSSKRRGFLQVRCFNWVTRRPALTGVTRACVTVASGSALHDCVLCKSGMKKPFVGNLADAHVDVQREHRMVGGKDSNACGDGDGATGYGHRMPLHLHRELHYCGEEGWM